MNISGVKAFLTIVSSKSISKAADLLFLSQSTVSLQLKSLEDELGVVLFERGKGYRYAELTPKGKGFVSIAERFVQLYDEAQILRYDKEEKLTISSVDSLFHYTFASFFQHILDAKDHMGLKLFTHQSQEIYEQVENRVVDLGFVLRVVHYQNVIVKPLFREEMFLVKAACSTSTAQEVVNVHPTDLDFEKELLLNWSPEFSQWHEMWCGSKTPPKVQIDTIPMLMCLLKGDHWSILPISVIRVLEKSTPLQISVLEDGPPDRTCYMLQHKYQKPTQIQSIKKFENELSHYLNANSDSLGLKR